MVKVVCPECESDKVYFVNGKVYQINHVRDKVYYCESCGHYFNEPTHLQEES